MTIYRVLTGIHIQDGKTYGRDLPDGDVFESSENMKKFNAPGANKFDVLEDDDPVAMAAKAGLAEAVDGLSNLSVGELRVLADKESVDLSTLRRKSEIVAEIRRVRDLESRNPVEDLAEVMEGD